MKFQISPIGEVAKAQLKAGPQHYLPTGLSNLDRLILGVVSSELTLVAGAPSQGKTALAMQILEHNASQGVPVGIVSMEMSATSLAQRMLATRTNVPMHVIRTRKWTGKKQQADVAKAANELRALPLYVISQGSMTPNQLVEAVKALADHGSTMVVIDYLQLASGGSDNRQQEVGGIALAAKGAAVNLNIPVIGLSQINRAAGAREDKEPRMSDLRDSGVLEQAADTILMFHYPNAPADKEDEKRDVDIHIVKQRNGPRGKVSCSFHGPSTKFSEVT